MLNAYVPEQWVTEEMKGEIKKFLEVNEDDDRTYQNTQDTAKSVLGGRFVAIGAYMKK